MARPRYGPCLGCGSSGLLRPPPASLHSAGAITPAFALDATRRLAPFQPFTRAGQRPRSRHFSTCPRSNHSPGALLQPVRLRSILPAWGVAIPHTATLCGGGTSPDPPAPVSVLMPLSTRPWPVQGTGHALDAAPPGSSGVTPFCRRRGTQSPALRLANGAVGLGAFVPPLPHGGSHSMAARGACHGAAPVPSNFGVLRPFTRHLRRQGADPPALSRLLRGREESPAARCIRRLGWARMPGVLRPGTPWVVLHLRRTSSPCCDGVCHLSGSPPSHSGSNAHWGRSSCSSTASSPNLAAEMASHGRWSPLQLKH